MAEIKIEKLRADAVLPKRAHPGDAGWDLYVPKEAREIRVRPGKVAKVPLGIAIALPEPEDDFVWELQLRPRSGNALKRQLTFANAVGTIDSGYRGEISVLVHNFGDVSQKISPGDKIGQAVLSRAYNQEYSLVLVLDDSERGEGGFGSTDE